MKPLPSAALRCLVQGGGLALRPLLLLALLVSAGCITRVVTSRGPASTTALGVNVELAPEVSGESTTTGGNDDSATITSGPTTIVIDRMNLTINGRSYGLVKQGDRVLVEKDKVSVNGEPRTAQDK